MGQELDEGMTATDDSSMQDVQNRLEDKLFPQESEPSEEADDVVSEDEEILPEDDDTEEVEDEGSDDEANEASLADFLGVDDDRIIEREDGTVAINAIIDGETKQVDLKELVSSYQLQGHVNNKSIALENERKQFDEQKIQVSHEATQVLQNLDLLSNKIDEYIMGDYGSVDWDGMKADNPQEWSIRRQEFADKAQKLHQLKALIHQEGQKAFELQHQEMSRAAQEHMQNELKLLVQHKPEWADQERMKNDVSSMRNFLAESYNFSEDELNMVQDHRLVKLALDAQAYRNGKKSAEKKINKKSVPKFQKSGVSQQKSAQLSKARQVKAKKQQLKNTGNISDAANLLLDRM